MDISVLSNCMNSVMDTVWLDGVTAVVLDDELPDPEVELVAETDMVGYANACKCPAVDTVEPTEDAASSAAVGSSPDAANNDEREVRKDSGAVPWLGERPWENDDRSEDGPPDENTGAAKW